MAPPDRFRSRKQPKQRRSEETRRQILDAAARVFEAHGYVSGTTNRIAEAAELSVGSLYQYFPNKDAILRALMQDHLEAGARHLMEQLSGGLPDDLEAALRVVVRATIDNHRDQPRLHRVLFEEAPRAPDFLAQLHESESALVEAAAGLLDGLPGARMADPKLAARMVVTTIESVVHRLITSPDPVDAALVEDELVAMLSAYLQ